MRGVLTYPAMPLCPLPLEICEGDEMRLKALSPLDAVTIGITFLAFASLFLRTDWGYAAMIWKPVPLTTWQWQLTGTVDQSFNVQVYDIDLFDNDASVISSLHSKGRKVICYMSAGTYENWRPDASSFPSSVLGSGNGWPGEKWLDIRQISILAPIMRARMDLAVQKGCDAIEPDNIDGYSNNTGFPLSGTDQINYNRFLATEAHERGLSIGLKNDIDQVPDLVNDFDWALNEQCSQYNECNTLVPFINAGKAVFNAEYSGNSATFCPKMNALKISSIKKNLDLDAPMTPCWTSADDPAPGVPQNLRFR
jgi:hypothetical protein